MPNLNSKGRTSNPKKGRSLKRRNPKGADTEKLVIGREDQIKSWSKVWNFKAERLDWWSETVFQKEGVRVDQWSGKLPAKFDHFVSLTEKVSWSQSQWESSWSKRKLFAEAHFTEWAVQFPEHQHLPDVWHEEVDHLRKAGIGHAGVDRHWILRQKSLKTLEDQLISWEGL